MATMLQARVLVLLVARGDITHEDVLVLSSRGNLGALRENSASLKMSTLSTYEVEFNVDFRHHVSICLF